MIKKIDHRNIEMAQRIYTIFQASYKIEAKLLKAEYFPPLARTQENFMNSDTQFYAFWEANELAGLIEVLTQDKLTDIHSLVVHPNYFRRGIAKQLMNYIFTSNASNTFVVETGLENIPAINLYTKLGFLEVKRWLTDIGINKIKFIKAAAKQ